MNKKWILACAGKECVVPSWVSPYRNWFQHGPELQPGPEQMQKHLA